jgi:nicotinamidase-related amidase
MVPYGGVVDRGRIQAGTAHSSSSMSRSRFGRQRPRWAAVSDPFIVAPVDRLVDAAGARGALVVWVLHAEPGTGAAFDPAGGHVRPIDGLCPPKGEPIITKPSSNAVTTTKLRQLLTTRGIGELVVWGLRTEQCGETTARVAADLGDEVTVVTDATATFPIPHRGAPTDRTVAESLADP